MKENNLLEQMSEIISEIQTINIWIDNPGQIGLQETDTRDSNPNFGSSLTPTNH
jgi:hypothetical protein